MLSHLGVFPNGTPGLLQKIPGLDYPLAAFDICSLILQPVLMPTPQASASDTRKEFSCTYCRRAFRRLEHLQRHTRRHTNEKPFPCRCGASFSRRDLLRRHERIADHSDSSDLPVQNLDGNEQLTPGQDHSPYITLDHRSTGQCHARSELSSGPYQSPHSLGFLTNPDRPLGNAFSPSENHLFSPIPEQGLQNIGHGGYPLFGNNQAGPSAYEFPTIFPSPQLSLATQIVPHFASPTVAPSDRTRLLLSLGRVEKYFPHPRLPSSNALTRYLAGYFTGFYPHFPFTHAPTFKLESCSPELCLAMMAIGALDRFESTSAAELFYYSKSLLFASRRNSAQFETKQSMASSGEDATSRRQFIDEVRCLLCLAQFATWQSDPSLRNEACVLQSLLGQSLRLSGLEESPQAREDIDWKQWARRESERRTKLFAFCFLGIHSIAFDVPPIIWCDEVNLKLPCSCPEWTAPDATTWSLLRQDTPHEQRRFQDTLDALLSSDHSVEPKSLAPSPIANYVLIHGLLQKILWTRRSLAGSLSLASSNDSQTIFESALRKWTSSWQKTPESNLEPLDPNGPLPFTSSALLSLAYIRNCFDVFRTRKIFTWEPAEIAQSIRASPPVDREWSSFLAASHATNFLATLVKLGIQYLKHNQSVLWSIEATLCGLDCSIFLEKWLVCIQDTMHDVPLTDREIHLVEWIQEVVYEGLSSVNEHSIERTVQPAILPDRIITVWSHIMHGNSPFSFIQMIGEVLVEYRRLSARNQ